MGGEVGLWPVPGPPALFLGLPYSLRAGAQPEVGARGALGASGMGTDSEALVQAFQPLSSRVLVAENL